MEALVNRSARDSSRSLSTLMKALTESKDVPEKFLFQICARLLEQPSMKPPELVNPWSTAVYKELMPRLPVVQVNMAVKMPLEHP